MHPSTLQTVQGLVLRKRFLFQPYACSSNIISYMASLNFSLVMPANSAVPPSVTPAGRDGFSMASHNSLAGFFQHRDVVFTQFSAKAAGC